MKPLKMKVFSTKISNEIDFIGFFRKVYLVLFSISKSLLSSNKLKLFFMITLGIYFYMNNQLIFFMIAFALIEAISCFVLRAVYVKGWVEILSFTTILISLNYGFKVAFFYFIFAYMVSMASRMRIYPVEPPYLLIRALTLGLIPVILPFSNLIMVTLITMIIQRLLIGPVLVFFGVPFVRVAYESVLNIIFTLALINYFAPIMTFL
ncbi:MAG: hypothetical protein ACMXYG_05310 [Candidatus Woesearchaeota archaeon]